MPDAARHLTLLCPGQGAQAVGMGRAWFEAQPVAAQTFAVADRHLGFSLSDLCFHGPVESLRRTDRAQLAIYTTSVACYQALLETGQVSTLGATAGLSLGEFTALHLAGAFDFREGLELVKLRGEAMQDAAEASRGSMVALTGEASEQQIQELCTRARGAEAERGAAAAGGGPGDGPDLEVDGSSGGSSGGGGGGEVLVPANFNSPMQVVVSGTAGACGRAVAVAEEMGFKATPLSVAGAFHSPLMQPAADRLREALEKVQWNLPNVPVLSNVTGRPHEEDIDSIKQRLVEQLTHPVRWSQSMQWAIEHLGPGSGEPTRFVELAPGKVLSGLMRRIDRGTTVENFEKP